ncbi:MAG: hypothetical protein HQK79_09100 [Desulfobacterales bacterium]|nr:hypothetical protein [Desulfobacterales bacterium]MBF0397592.1 hypothetical protein [Desulfobacterales bacterium]
MKRKSSKIFFVTTFGLLFVFFSFAHAEDHSQHNHGSQPQKTVSEETQSHEGHDMAENKTQIKGQLIIEKNVDGYTLSYYLLNLEERKETMKGMEGMKMHGMSDSPDVTNHLMVYIKGSDGKYASGKVGFNITNPDATTFKSLTMGMYGGYGADVIFKAKGKYKIQMKATTSDKKINDEITYEVK